MSTVRRDMGREIPENNYLKEENEEKQKSFDNMIMPIKTIIKNEINGLINSKIKQKFSTSLEIDINNINSLNILINYLKSIDKKIARNVIPSYIPSISKLNKTTSCSMFTMRECIYVYIGNGVIIKIKFVSASHDNPDIALLTFYGPVYKTLKYKEVQFINGLAKISKRFALASRDLAITKTTFITNKITGEIRLKNTIVSNLRRFNSIFCNDKTILDTLNTFLDNFISKNDKFTKYGLSYKTGIMIHGLPGTGKTSLAFAIACELRYKLAAQCGSMVISPRVSYIDMLNIKDCIDQIKESYYNGAIDIVVLEDIDYIFGKREDAITPEEKQNANDLLQLLDGYLSIDNSICIATTNYYDKLDSALIRSGRFDLTIEMDYLNKATAIEMCKHYEVDYKKVFEEVESFPVSPAYLQSIIIKYM